MRRLFRLLPTFCPTVLLIPRLLSLVLAMVLSLAATTASAVTIFYAAENLTDTIPGEDLWQYTYTVVDFTHGTDYGFTIGFDLALYTDLEDPPPAVNADWDVITIQPDLLLPDHGYYDALALSASPSLADAFVVEFVWLGAETPGSQAFGVYDPTFQFVETGETVVVPEPGSALLLGLALACLSLARSDS